MAKITVLKVNNTKAPKGYNIAEVAYKTDDGKTKGMRVVDFAQPEVFDVVKDLKPGDVADAQFEQNAKGFWQFKVVNPTGEKGDVTEAAKPATRGNWETPEERAAKGVQIARQSSLQRALEFYELNKAKPSVAEVCQTAEAFKDYVFNGPQAGGGSVE